MNDVVVNFTDGNLNPQLPGQDHISGIILYSAGLPSGFDTDDRIKAAYSVQDASALGITSAAAGVIPILAYQIAEFFRINPGAKLWIGVFAVPESFDFTEIATLQRYAEGECRQIAVLSPNVDSFLVTQVDAIQTVCDTLKGEHKPTVVFFEPQLVYDFAIGDLPSLAAKEAPNVAVVVGADAGNNGYELEQDQEIQISCVGAVLGASSKALAHESIAWVSKFNLVTGKELDVPRLLSGELIRNLSESALSDLQDKRYIFLRKHIGISGTYLNDSLNANLASSDYNAVERVKVANKAGRLLRAAFLPTLSGPILLEGGKIQKDVVASLNAIGNKALDQLLRTGEISERSVFVNPDQDIVNTSVLVVTAKVVPVGVARNIEINFSFNVTV
jgi:hypothetical protein